MYMRLTPREKEMADMFEQMSKEEQEIMIELAKRMRTEEPEKLLKEIKQRLNIDDGVQLIAVLPFERGKSFFKGFFLFSKGFRKLQHQAKTSYTLSTEEVEVLI